MGFQRLFSLIDKTGVVGVNDDSSQRSVVQLVQQCKFCFQGFVVSAKVEPKPPFCYLIANMPVEEPPRLEPYVLNVDLFFDDVYLICQLFLLTFGIILC
jgi:hypothetical protein